MQPKLEEVKRLAERKDYKRIPVWRTILSDTYTPIEVLRILRKADNHCYLLESASQEAGFGRYSFLGFCPEMEVTCLDHQMQITELGENGQREAKSFYVEHPKEVLRKLIADNKSPMMEDLPYFTGGFVGYFAYDYIKYEEPKLNLSSEKGAFNDLDLMLFDRVIAFDHFKQQIYLIAGVRTDEIEENYARAEKRIAEMEELLKKGDKKEFRPLVMETELEHKFSQKEFCDMVEKAKHYIREGDIFQVVLSNPLLCKAKGSLFDTYRILRGSNPSPYMFYFTSDNIEIAGASPETLVKKEGNRLSTFPLAGTRPRGHAREEDEALERELLSDEKELAEHNMLVDLGRNDMGRISKINTVFVEDYLAIQRYSQVMHISSKVVGEIDEKKDAIDAIDAILPAGTLSGAPKFRACQIIEELEGSKRGIYGGAIGYLDFSGNLDVCISIRLVYKKDDEICVRSGAGIVADSDPEKEYQECHNKAKAVVLAMEKAKGGLK